MTVVFFSDCENNKDLNTTALKLIPCFTLIKLHGFPANNTTARELLDPMCLVRGMPLHAGKNILKNLDSMHPLSVPP